MPVVLVTAPALDSRAAELDALAAINRAIAVGLGLRPTDVYAAFCPTATAALGDEQVTAWPVVLIHGSARARELMDEAKVRVRNEISERWRCDIEMTWVQWIVSA